MNKIFKCRNQVQVYSLYSKGEEYSASEQSSEEHHEAFKGICQRRQPRAPGAKPPPPVSRTIDVFFMTICWEHNTYDV